MKKQNIAIVAVVAFVLAVAVGYALFSETLQIKGTATAKGTFDIEFTKIGEIISKGYTKTESSSDVAVIGENGKSLTITVNKLDYPGAYVEIPVTITNKGTIPAKLKQISQTGPSEENTDIIKVSYTGPASTDTPISSEQTQEMTVKVEWLENDAGDDTKSRDVTATFTITLDYEQATNE